ncbi:hypothetical protein ACWDT5_26105 [Rhodococcus aetherivorans]|uniref:Uncharacterized protein n=1 Tax=Rhodococcus aetherivorans TaxID=191292 RepID=A0AA46PWS9_9NOCA|nr:MULTISPECIES: hypothetical protein [Rhodococcus]ANZ23442.1 hypothetical protein A4U64_01035 [Rhodococcus sp. WB1]KDE10791.1 hypothetical protein N505_0121390 [Rhodococcus aetherivorans]UGQ41965.1 hypothetical protein LRQ66_01080 [Rhodococcus aetherivorans]UYF95066.1 hypothetical protein OCS65_04625 [Rhodococcus aetherivorans]
MTTETETSNPRERMIIYAVVAFVVVLLVFIALLLFPYVSSSGEAEAKADQLIAALDEAGARTPAREQITRVLGDDGGAICANPNAALTRATLLSQMVNGAGGPGTRPVVVDDRVVQGELLVLEIYCPEELAEFQQFVGTLETSDVAGE